MADTATGTFAFLFTDIQGSTQLFQNHPEAMKNALARHHAILTNAIEVNNGKVSQISGDSFLAAFPTALDALRAAVSAQQKLYAESWRETGAVRVRMGIHVGAVQIRPDDGKSGQYHGYSTLALAQRIMSAGHGGQILLSRVTYDLLRNEGFGEFQMLDLGQHRLKDIAQPERLFQLIIPNLPHDFPPLRTLDVHPNNIPAQLTSFVGREKEIREVKQLLENTRILSLVGPGGTGKTRLSIQTARDILHKYKAGIWFVELAPVSNPALVPSVTATALKLPTETKRLAIDMLCDYLRERQLLLMLDNCEHLVEACAQTADTLLRSCPGLHILVSSREVLGIPGEVTYRVPSLKVPDIKQLPSIDSLTKYEAVKLFIERATAVLPDFQVTNDTAPALARICHRLDGIPLAIELAATKVSVLSIDQISARLEDRFRLLTGGSRTGLERHQTLRATIEWSYNLLSPRLQTLFRRLSVFVNGWSLEGAEMVCLEGTGEGEVRCEDVLDLIIQLVNKSLVIAETGLSESRYRMLETVRQYASDRLVEAGEGEDLRDRHLEYFLSLAETAEPHLRRTEQIEWLDRLEVDHDNLRSALEWALGKPAAELSLRLAGALGPFWDTRGHWKEGANWLHSALSKQSNITKKAEKSARAKALYRNAELAEELDNLDYMKELSEASYHLCQELGDNWGTAYSRWLIAYCMSRMREETNPVKPLVSKSMSDFVELGDPWGQSQVLTTYAWILYYEGKQKEFHETKQKLIALARKSGDRKLIADKLLHYGGPLVTIGEWKQAEKLLAEAERLAVDVEYSGAVEIIKIYLAELAFARGEYKKAENMMLDCLEFLRLKGEKNFRSFGLFLLALVSNAKGDIQQAKTYLQDGLDIQIEMGSFIALIYIAMLGYLNFKQGNFVLAKEKMYESLELARNVPDSGFESVSVALTFICNLFAKTNSQAVVQIMSATEMEFQKLNVPRDSIVEKPIYEQNLAAARAEVREDEFNTNWEIGEKMSVADAIDCALELIDEIQ